MRRLVLYLVMPQILILFGAELAVLGGVKLAYRQGYPDLLAPYEAIMPGQPKTGLAMYPCTIPRLPVSATQPIEYCDILPRSGPVTSVRVAYDDQVIRMIWLRVTHMYVGDLAARWGRPESVSQSQDTFYASWDGIYAMMHRVAPSGRYHYMLPVWYVRIGIGSQFPCGGCEV